MASPTNVTGAPPAHRRNTHRLPLWMAWVQDNILLSALVIAEGYLLGSLFVMGWVANIEDPASWGIYHLIGVIVFFAAGLCCGGIALKCSAKMAESFSQGHPILGLANLLGLLVFSTADIWASLVERAAHLLPGPADLTLLSLLGWGGTAIGPTNLAIAILLPFAVLFSGLSQTEEGGDSLEERERKHRAKMQRLAHQAEERSAWASGMVHAGRAALAAAKASPLGEETGDLPAGKGDEEGPGVAARLATESGPDSPRKHLVALQAQPRPEPLKGRITARELTAWVRDTLETEISERDALGLLKTIPGYGRTRGTHGGALSAPKPAALQRAKALWGRAPDRAASAG